MLWKVEYEEIVDIRCITEELKCVQKINIQQK